MSVSNDWGALRLDNFDNRGAVWTRPHREKLREVWQDITIPKRAFPQMFGRSLAAIENQAAKMHLGPRPVVTREAKEAPASVPRRQSNEAAAMREAEAQADRIRAYWADRDKTVVVEVVKISIRNAAPVFSPRIVGAV